MQLFLEVVRQVVSTDSTLLLLGETGVGKEHLARAFMRKATDFKVPLV